MRALLANDAAIDADAHNMQVLLCLVDGFKYEYKVLHIRVSPSCVFGSSIRKFIFNAGSESERAAAPINPVPFALCDAGCGPRFSSLFLLVR